MTLKPRSRCQAVNNDANTPTRLLKKPDPYICSPLITAHILNLPPPAPNWTPPPSALLPRRTMLDRQMSICSHCMTSTAWVQTRAHEGLKMRFTEVESQNAPYTPKLVAGRVGRCAAQTQQQNTPEGNRSPYASTTGVKKNVLRNKLHSRNNWISLSVWIIAVIKKRRPGI